MNGVSDQFAPIRTNPYSLSDNPFYAYSLGEVAPKIAIYENKTWNPSRAKKKKCPQILSSNALPFWEPKKRLGHPFG